MPFVDVKPEDVPADIRAKFGDHDHPEKPNYRGIAIAAAEHYGLDPDIFVRQINHESGFNPNAAGSSGEIGIAQIMPDTAKAWKVNPHDPIASLDTAAGNMAAFVKTYGGDYAKALAAYNAGPGAVHKYGGVPPYPKTQRYIAAILGGKGGPTNRMPAAGIPEISQGVPQYGSPQLPAGFLSAGDLPPINILTPEGQPQQTMPDLSIGHMGPSPERIKKIQAEAEQTSQQIQQQLNRTYGPIIQNLKRPAPVEPPSPDLITGLGNIANKIGSGLQQGAGHVWDMLRYPGDTINQITGAAKQDAGNAGGILPAFGASALKSVADIPNFFTGLPAEIANAYENRNKYSPAFGIDTSGLESAMQKNPTAAFFGGLAPALALDLMTGGGAAAKDIPLYLRMAKHAGIGAGFGVAGSGGSLENRAAGGVEMGAAGLGLGVLGELVGGVVGKFKEPAEVRKALTAALIQRGYAARHAETVSNEIVSHLADIAAANLKQGHDTAKLNKPITDTLRESFADRSKPTEPIEILGPSGQPYQNPDLNAASDILGKQAVTEPTESGLTIARGGLKPKAQGLEIPSALPAGRDLLTGSLLEQILKENQEKADRIAEHNKPTTDALQQSFANRSKPSEPVELFGPGGKPLTNHDLLAGSNVLGKPVTTEKSEGGLDIVKSAGKVRPPEADIEIPGRHRSTGEILGPNGKPIRPPRDPIKYEEVARQPKVDRKDEPNPDQKRSDFRERDIGKDESVRQTISGADVFHKGMSEEQIAGATEKLVHAAKNEKGQLIKFAEALRWVKEHGTPEQLQHLLNYFEGGRRDQQVALKNQSLQSGGRDIDNRSLHPFAVEKYTRSAKREVVNLREELGSDEAVRDNLIERLRKYGQTVDARESRLSDSRRTNTKQLNRLSQRLKDASAGVEHTHIYLHGHNFGETTHPGEVRNRGYRLDRIRESSLTGEKSAIPEDDKYPNRIIHAGDILDSIRRRGDAPEALKKASRQFDRGTITKQGLKELISGYNDYINKFFDEAKKICKEL